MRIARAIRPEMEGDEGRALFERIGAFLLDQRLAPTPTNYAFVHRLFTEPEDALARAVELITERGVRITPRDIQTLSADHSPEDPSDGHADLKARTEGLVARTQMQVEGFADMVTAMRAETADFGRDLAASAEAMTTGGDVPQANDDVVRITAAMLDRIRVAEEKLESTTREANDLREKLEEARDNARRDPLTQLPNRRAFEEAFAAQEAAGGSMCIAVCDIDHFKSVNDRFGHAVGDRVLRVIADALSLCCRGHLVTRYGGEEFAILFTNVPLDQARAVLEHARGTVQAKRYKLRDNDAPLGEITFSAGLTPVEPGEMHQTAFHRADRLLYLAKHEGRNQVKIGSASYSEFRR
ncbi:GGDEF domain-containing protein [Sphingomonas sp. ABOLD]|uniref:diguanylate cyclase n=1 Tax=Sphingomonas trueperi TaxID=53317 RepID=A0A7X5Y1G8_9SPHN|nr:MULTISPECIES: GGDEF domain-containing protein [Sphingomonas]NJB98045.1 diguanylate cyclase [Sphingomonas trueperi]RSV42223.1 GGDEF domain-containing protein [Sphingomonas sp. ABOLE]RSV46337.1 GGDEF domain-containing protein [Sphingomonas sp. ABOLD]